MSSNIALEKINKIKVKEPCKYNVVMYNDDFTTMEFVVHILVNIFDKSNEEAVHIMMTVHKKGKSVVGKYSYDIAMTKAELAMAIARSEGFPFKIKVEQE